VLKTLEIAEKATGERVLGKDPKTGRTVLVRLSKFGPVAQIGTPEELGEEKPHYAGLMLGQSIETITFEDAMKLFELPKSLGMLNDKEVMINRGRFGPYIKYGEDYISVPKTYDLFSIQLKDARPIIEEKMKEKAPIGTHEEMPITKGVGRFGPYVKWNNSYVPISKKSGYDFATITGDQAIELIKEKAKRDEARTLKEWPKEKIRILQGRWGPFLKVEGDKKMYRLKLPSDKEEAKKLIDAMTLEEAKKVIGK
jgi:DNA topoisomerase-1